MFWIDTHCHLDFLARPDEAVRAARENGVGMIVVPAVKPDNFSVVRALSQSSANVCHALGIHPLFTSELDPVQALAALREALTAGADDPRLVAVGEIGLDYFVDELKTSEASARQEFIFVEQLRLAREFDLPVLLHVRRSQDRVLKYLRQIRSARGGIAHAFNGSRQQADAFAGLGYVLGLGGAMTFARSLQIRRLAAGMPDDSLVLETDAPDIAPVWRHPAPNAPDQIPGIGAVMAELREVAPERVAAFTSANALRVLPRLAALTGEAAA